MTDKDYFAQCKQCGVQIPPRKVAHAGIAHRPVYCSRLCRHLWQKANGYYIQLSGIGNTAQTRYGTRQRAERNAAISASNAVKPRRAVMSNAIQNNSI